MKQFFAWCLAVLFLSIFPGAAWTVNREKGFLPGPFGQAAPSVPSEARYADQVIHVYLPDGLTQMNEEEYLVGVVAAEMPAAYHEEALKAQAVAARTYLERKRAGNGCSRCQGADICAFSGHCQAYRNEESRRALWGKRFDFYEQKIRAAVSATRGEVLTYQGKLIDAMYHASSFGRTEDCLAVYGNPRDYLVSVSTPETQGVCVKTELERSVLARKLEQQFPGCGVTPDNLETTLAVGCSTPSGRAESVRIGSVEISAARFRGLIGLRSTDFSVQFTPGTVIFTVNGHGHGLGMSQMGANLLAKRGMNYREILLHYYQGVNLECPGK